MGVFGSHVHALFPERDGTPGRDEGALEPGAGRSPETVCITLAQACNDHNALARDAFSALLPPYVATSHPKSGLVLRNVWSRHSVAVIRAMVDAHTSSRRRPSESLKCARS